MAADALGSELMAPKDGDLRGSGPFSGKCRYGCVTASPPADTAGRWPTSSATAPCWMIYPLLQRCDVQLELQLILLSSVWNHTFGISCYSCFTPSWLWTSKPTSTTKVPHLWRTVPCFCAKTLCCIVCCSVQFQYFTADLPACVIYASFSTHYPHVRPEPGVVSQHGLCHVIMMLMMCQDVCTFVVTFSDSLSSDLVFCRCPSASTCEELFVLGCSLSLRCCLQTSGFAGSQNSRSNVPEMLEALCQKEDCRWFHKCHRAWLANEGRSGKLSLSAIYVKSTT